MSFVNDVAEPFVLGTNERKKLNNLLVIFLIQFVLIKKTCNASTTFQANQISRGKSFSLKEMRK